MNFLNSLFRSKSKQKIEEEEESITYIKVYFDEELSAYRGLPLFDDTDRDKLMVQILTFPEIKQIFTSPSLENMGLTLLISEKKTGQMVLRRKVHEFEIIKDI